MSEATPQKRVLPARERADSTAKRRASSPVVPTPPPTEPRQKRKYTKRASLIKPSTPAAGTPTPSTPGEDALPTKLQNMKLLPTLPQKQPEKLSNNEYQSIAESAVLAASLYRSRMQWLCDGVFKRYWTKPVKRKGVIEQPPGNPDGKSMSKLGNATMTIEPHVFDVTFYTVKDPASISIPVYRHPNQHTVNKQSIPPHSVPTSSAQTSQPIVRPAMGPSTSAAPPAPVVHSPTVSMHIKQETSDDQVKKSTQSASTPPVPAPTRPVAHPPTQSVPPASERGIRSSTDPVIQMLAARAATDNRLKELMKVVAMSQANTEQLREFQAHIDEFNRIIKERAAGETPKPVPTSVPAPPAPAAAHPATYSAPPRPHPGPPTSISGPMHMALPSHAGYPPPPPHRPEPYIKHIVIEFHSAVSVTQSASTDRWLFPEHAILDIKSGGMEMIASFFVVQKGEEILKRYGSTSDGDEIIRQQFKADTEYYQPVTMLIKATQHKTVETIARAAKSLPECQSYMKEVMEKMTRAPPQYLVHRLPRDKSLSEINTTDFIDSAVEMSNDEDDELRDVYGI